MKSNDVSMKKIGFIINSTGWGGLEMNVLKLAQWMSERNWEVILFINEKSRISEEINNYKLNFQTLTQHKKHFDLVNSLKFAKRLVANNINTLFVFDNKDLDFISLTKHLWFNKLKVVYQQHMQIGINKKDLIHTLRYSCINCWISPLEWLKNEVKARTHFNPNKISVIPLGIDIEKFYQNTQSKEDARKKININSNKPIIGIIGRIDPKKGQLFLVKALLELLNRKIDVELLIVGEPTINEANTQLYFSEIESFIIKNNLTEKIHIRPYSNDVQSFYNAIDIFALASHGETYGMVTIEAILSEVPVIATNTSGTPEILNFGEFGYLYEYENINNFCDQLISIIKNPEISMQKAKFAKNVAIKKYSHIAECEQIEDLLAKL